MSASALLWLLAHSLAPALALAVLTGIVEGPAFSGSVVIRQRRPPPAVRAQIISTMASVSVTATALGSAIGGSLQGPLAIILAFTAVNALAAITATVGHFQTSGAADRAATP